MTSLRYILAALALGAVAVWGSEVLFWSAPPDDLTAGGMVLTWVVYALAAAAALSAVLVTGCGGWAGLLLGGAILGWLVEGVVVATMYDAFPFQTVWTPLAWHALVTAVMVFGLGRMAGRLAAARLAIGWLGVGLFGGVWAWYWPLERAAMPGAGATIAYLAGLGLAVPLAQLALDLIGRLEPPPRAVIMAAPVLAALAWVAGTVAAPSPLRLACPLLIGVTLVAMRRLGSGRSAGLDLGPSAALWRHALFLIALLVAVPVALAGWRGGGREVNVPIALLTSVVSLALFGGLLWRAYTRKAASARPRSIAPS